MADFFGDSSLFEEFDKDRDGESSYIHYEEDNLRSRIVFESYDSDDDDNESVNQDADENIDEKSSNVTAAGAENTDADDGKQTGKPEEGTEKVKGEDDAQSSEGSSEKKGGESASNGSENKTDIPTSSAKVKSTATSSVDDAAAIDKETAWLNDQLYADADEEAKKQSNNVRQLVFDKNKFKRFAKILDTTRYVPDEESPAVQLLFNNNAFARKYRQQIEQFIKGLLWEEFHISGEKSENVPQIDVRPGAPSCIEINPSLPSSKRNETMRQRHTVLGNSQFHKQFLIDFLGWPFTTKEPTRCNQNWDVPLYGQVFDEVYADPTSAKKGTAKGAKPKPSCWNCGMENHSVAECNQPRNPTKISANRKLFMESQPKRTEPKFSGPNRYHLDPEIANKYSKFSPGVISPALQEALGVDATKLPQHIYKMRLYGYPPGWLAAAKQIQSGVSIFDKTGRETLITGECLEDGEVDEDGNKPEFDVNKIIEYPGFTVPVPLGVVDEHSTYTMPPIQEHQLKATLMSQMPSKTKKRKLVKDKEELKEEKDGAKKAKEGGDEEGEIKEEVAADDEGADTQPMEDDDQQKESDGERQQSDLAKTPLLNKSSSTISLSRDFSTPILVREKSDLPDPSKFSEGIEDHINFENLPNSVGTFEKMRNLISVIRKKGKN